MDQYTLEKIEEFSKLTPFMQLAFNKVVDEWSPELPPLTILFSEIGTLFINTFDLTENQTNKAVFNAVEAMLKGKDEKLNIGASTGFLEAIATKDSFTKSAKTMLGEESRTFLKSWTKFMDIQDKDL
jgi:predicted MPP superfamily phosphohydrolase